MELLEVYTWVVFKLICNCLTHVSVKFLLNTVITVRLKEREVSLHRDSSILFKHFLYWALKGPTDLKLQKSFHDENTEEHWAELWVSALAIVSILCSLSL